MEKLKDKFLDEYTENVIQMTALPPAITDIYEIYSCLKKDSLKSIYIIKGRKDGQKYLLKCSSPDCKENLSSEYSMLSSLSHTGLPKAVQFFKKDGWSYLIREYFDGITLSDMVEERDGLNVDESVKIISELCDILHYLHTQDPPIIHRDIKPQNIIYTNDGHCKLIDLGVSRRYRDGEAKDTVFMGTEATAAPEQFGYMQTDVRSDIYSLGVLMFYLLTGSLNVKKLNKYVLPRPIKKIIIKCVKFSPDDRYSSVAQLQTKLRRFVKAPVVIRYISICALVLIACTGAAILGPKLLGHNTPAKAVNAADKVTFSSPFIEKAVRVNLGKSDKETITYADLDNVTKILICGQTVYSRWDEHSTCGTENYLNSQYMDVKGDIKTLDDILKMPNLEELALYNQRISDISQLKGLKIRKLGLAGNSIGDISALSSCKGLVVLDVAGNPIRTISPLSKLTNLDDLDISSTKINDITPLKGLNIEGLSMIETRVTDHETLTTLPKIRKFRVRYLNSQGLRTISKLTTLTHLTIYESDIYNFEPFFRLTNLQDLDLNANDIKDLDGVEKLTQLVHIGLGQNSLKDLTPLSRLENLSSIDLTASEVSDYTPLKLIPRLNEVYCNEVERKSIKDQLGEVNFKFIIEN